MYSSSYDSHLLAIFLKCRSSEEDHSIMIQKILQGFEFSHLMAGIEPTHSKYMASVLRCNKFISNSSLASSKLHKPQSLYHYQLIININLQISINSTH